MDFRTGVRFSSSPPYKVTTNVVAFLRENERESNSERFALQNNSVKCFEVQKTHEGTEIAKQFGSNEHPSRDRHGDSPYLDNIFVIILKKAT